MEYISKKNNFESVILKELTLEKEGYDPLYLAGKSNKHIWVSCRYCGEPNRVIKSKYFSAGNSNAHMECRKKELKEVHSTWEREDVKKKIKDGYLEKYGVDHNSKIKEVVEKRKKTFIERYGVDNPSKGEVAKNKKKEKNANINGVKIENKENIIYKEIFSEKYISKYYEEDQKFWLLNSLKDENNNIWEDLKKNSLKYISNKYNIDCDKLRHCIYDNAEFYEKYKKTYSFPKIQKQLEIKKELEKIDSNILFNTRKIITPLELDIYLPDKKFAIEFNGSFWHSEACVEPKEARMKHRQKLDLCRAQGIRLFNIFENHWDTRSVQLLNFIKTILGANSIKVAARKCIISNTECREFINNNHIQGYGARTLKFFNLEYNGEIMASMTASKHHRQNVEGNPIVLNRLCFKDGVSVQGGSSKLFKQLLEWAKKEGYDRILSWSDNCWTEGEIYKVLGFSLVKEYDPDYFYWSSLDKKYYSKQSQQKKKTNCPIGMTEREWCEERGLFRIFDCGKKLFEFKIQ